MADLEVNNAPPPYPGYPAVTEQAQYPPLNPAYPTPYDSSKAVQDVGYPQGQGYAPGYPMPPAYPQASAPQIPPNQQPCYAWPGYGQPPQQGMAYASPYGVQTNYGHGTAVVLAPPIVTVIQTFREVPVHMNCPHCRAEVITSTHYETGTFAWVLCCVLFFIGFCLGCCLIPFCFNGCKDVIHSCPNCRQQIARYSRI